MRCEDLIKQVKKYYYKNEYLYFKTITSLEEVSKDLTKLEDNKHLIGVIKPFLIKWGRMYRVVGKERLNWEGFGKALRSSEDDFANLRNEKFYKIDFDDDKIMNSILTIYGEIDPLDYLGGPTTISKTLHILNPEIFVIWDHDIRQRYKKISKYFLWKA